MLGQSNATVPVVTGATRLITRSELRHMVPYTPQHILRLEKRGQFPKRVQVGPGRVAWVLAEVEAWIATRTNQRDMSATT